MTCFISDSDINYPKKTLFSMDRGQKLNQKVAEINAKFPGVRTVTPAQVQQLEREGRPVIYVDCRTPAEMAVSKIHPDAISERQCMHRLDSIRNMDTPAVVVGYCTIGYRSAKFVKKMAAKASDIEVVNLSGSILEWIHVGYDVWDASGSKTQKVHVWGREYCQYVPQETHHASYFKNPILATVFPDLFSREQTE